MTSSTHHRYTGRFTACRKVHRPHRGPGKRVRVTRDTDRVTCLLCIQALARDVEQRLDPTTMYQTPRARRAWARHHITPTKTHDQLITADYAQLEQRLMAISEQQRKDYMRKALQFQTAIAAVAE